MANERTNLTICNMALGYIAKSRITSLTDSTEEARQCNLYYDHLRQQLLTSYNWGFAKRVSALALVSDTTMFGYDYVYALSCVLPWLYVLSTMKARKQRNIKKKNTRYSLILRAYNV